MYPFASPRGRSSFGNNVSFLHVTKCLRKYFKVFLKTLIEYFGVSFSSIYRKSISTYSASYLICPQLRTVALKCYFIRMRCFYLSWKI